MSTVPYPPCPECVNVGDRFFRLCVVEGPISDPAKRVPRFRCLCDCGNEIYLTEKHLLRREQKSCGCAHYEHASQMLFRHGESRTPLYNAWSSLRQRCLNPNATAYRNYGARGIDVAPEWDDYVNFRDWALANGYRDDLEIDRRDNDRGYTPDNCRWVTRAENAYNRRVTRLLTAFGETKNILAWSEDPRCTVNYNTLRQRLWKGVPDQLAITHPYTPRGQRVKNKLPRAK